MQRHDLFKEMLVKAGIHGDVYELIGCMYFMSTFHVYEYSLSFKIFIVEMTKSQRQFYT